MFVLLATAALAFQDADLRRDADTPDAVTEDTAETEPTDAPTLIARFEANWADWGDLVGQIAARKARERYLAELLLPVISRDDLDEGARGEILAATHTVIAETEASHTQWAGRQINPDTFAAFHAAQPRAAMDLVRLAERDDSHRTRLVAALEPVALAGAYDGAAFADMADALALAENRPQPYGTALTCVDGTWQAWEIADPENLGERRAALGLPETPDPQPPEAGDCETDEDTD